MKRAILKGAEKYSVPLEAPKRGGAGITYPYSYSVSKSRILSNIHKTIEEFNSLPDSACPNDNVVAKVTMHPSFVSRSSFPSSLIKKYKLKNLGSKEELITPEAKLTNKQKEQEKISTSVYYVSGEKNNYEKLLNDLFSDDINKTQQKEVQTIEKFSSINVEEKTAHLDIYTQERLLTYEVVLHASDNDLDVIEGFYAYASSIGCDVHRTKTRTVKGLTFCFIDASSNLAKDIALYSFVRVLRKIPELHVNNIDYIESHNYDELIAPLDIQKNDSVDIAIFDGGIGAQGARDEYVQYFDLTHELSHEADSYYLTHGENVTSTVVFGDVNNSDNTPLCVDHYKVISKADEIGANLVNVLDRIKSVLKEKRYRFVNLSLGPKVPCSDDEPSLWTATLDELASEGDMLFVVAAGNALYAASESLLRIQPPADMLNGLSVGAANSRGQDWKRNETSCIGPGRKPGYVKPDLLAFAGSSDDKIKLLTLGSSKFYREVHGATSYAAPLVTRLAGLIDKATDKAFTPAAIRALIIHTACQNKEHKTEVGWGRAKPQVNDVLFCADDAVTMVYQGKLESTDGVRVDLPCPSDLSAVGGNVTLKGTLCFYTDVDQNHAVSYTKSGIEVTLRPDKNNKDVGKNSPKTKTFFSLKNILGNDGGLRHDAHQWETCVQAGVNMRATSLYKPVLDIRYKVRDAGHAQTKEFLSNLPGLNYALVITISSNKELSLYDKILNEFDLLSPVVIENNATIEV